MAKLTVTNLNGSLECDRKKARPIAFQVISNAFYGPFTGRIREMDPKDLGFGCRTVMLSLFV